MILIADGGSTKADWIALDGNKEEVFRVRTKGLNPAVVPEEVLRERIINTYQLYHNKADVETIYFYGAGCGTDEAKKILKRIFESIFTSADVIVEEDLLAAVYAAAGGDPAIVAILGTGSNSCYWDGKEVHTNSVSLGYILMDEASGNYFGKRIIRDYFFKRMPEHMMTKLEDEYNLEPDHIKFNLYRQPNPNTYLATFAKFMFQYKEEKYIKQLMRSGYEAFFECRILPYKKGPETPIYFIGSIAHYFSDLLDEVAASHGLKITGIIQRPIDNLLEYHKGLL
ncbi:N-acetylglucosamine kinase [Flavobacteriaceae bacterium]|nr:N-acetylglucosamine kinase [Flavobacteriaceae bacterium]